MVDTIKIFTQDFTLAKDNKFIGKANIEADGEVRLIKKICNNIEGVNLTIQNCEQDGETALYFQTSVPKLLYGTSYFEVKEQDGERAKDVIENKLTEAGVLYPKNNLQSFDLSRLDLCRNIQVDYPIENYLTCLKNFDMSKRNKQNFKQETLTYYNKRQELSFYNKIKEIKDTEKSTETQLFISDKPENILRIESRLKQKKVIETELNKKIKFENIFNFNLCKDNLIKNMSRLAKKDTQLELSFEDEDARLTELRAQHARDISDKYIFQIGFQNFFASKDHDWELVRKFLIDKCGLSRAQSYKKISQYKDIYFKFLIPIEERQLIAEIKDKICIA